MPTYFIVLKYNKVCWQQFAQNNCLSTQLIYKLKRKKKEKENCLCRVVQNAKNFNYYCLHFYTMFLRYVSKIKLELLCFETLRNNIVKHKHLKIWTAMFRKIVQQHS